MVCFACVACANRAFGLTFPMPFQLRMFSSRVLCLHGGKKLPSTWTVYERNTKYLCITCAKSVCQSWTFKCLPCAGAAVGAGQNEFCSENRHPPDDIEPTALENESLGEERSDNSLWADECDDAEYLHLPLIETRDKSINTLEQETFSSTQPASTFDVATLSSAVFL